MQPFEGRRVHYDGSDLHVHCVAQQMEVQVLGPVAQRHVAGAGWTEQPGIVGSWTEQPGIVGSWTGLHRPALGGVAARRVGSGRCAEPRGRHAERLEDQISHQRLPGLACCSFGDMI